VLDELGQLGINGEQTSGSPVENLALSTADAGDQVVSLILVRCWVARTTCCGICWVMRSRW